MPDKTYIPKPLPKRNEPKVGSSRGQSADSNEQGDRGKSAGASGNDAESVVSESSKHQMDKKIERGFWTRTRITYSVGSVLVLLLVIYAVFLIDSRVSLQVQTNRLTIAEVIEGEFQENIPETGVVMPINTRFIDAIEGGVIQEIMVESGAMVEAGDTILVLTNSSLQLDVLSREAQLYEQINNLQNTRMNIQQNNLTLQSNLAEINYQLAMLKPQFERQSELFEKKLISKQEFEQSRENYEYQQKRLALSRSSYERDSVFQVVQLRQLEESADRLWKNLQGVMKILDNLVVRASTTGQITLGDGTDLDLGQSVSSGQRLGQIDDLDGFKVRVGIDEYYLPRISQGDKAEFTFDGSLYHLSIYKIYPSIRNGVFEVDMEFDGDIPSRIRRGQTLPMRMKLGTSQKTLKVARGGFYQKTAGNWIFLVNKSGTGAEKHPISLGRQNTEYFEVASGLKLGDKVVISSYETFGDAEILNFN